MANIFNRTSQQKPNPLIPAASAAKPRHPYGLDRKVLLGLEGQVYTPEGLFVQQASLKEGVAIEEAEWGISGLDIQDGMDFEDNSTDKKERQWRNWTDVIMPSMIQPYVELICKTEGFRKMDKVRIPLGCQGCNNGRILDVVCIYFESMLNLLNLSHSNIVI